MQKNLPQTDLGKTGLRASRLGFGGATLGFSEGRSEGELKAVVRAALEGGVTFFDTAPDYRASERLIGEALGAAEESAVIATKVGRYQRLEKGHWHVYEDWSADGVYKSVERSLAALQVETVDLLQLHSPPLEVLERGEAFKGMRRAQSDGLVRHLGVSADGEVARRALATGDFETLQISYSVLEQDSTTLLDEAVRQGVGIIVKQPVANGIPDLQVRPEHPDWARKWERAQAMDLEQLGKRGERTVGALRWLLADERVDTAIVGTSKLEHLQTNLEAAHSPINIGTFRALEDEWRESA